MKVGLVQLRTGIIPDANCAEVEQLIRAAAGEGAQYVQTPEMTGILQKNRRSLFENIHSQENDPVVALAGRLSKELGIWLHIGSQAIDLGGEIAANRAFVFSPMGDLAASYDKIHMFDVDLDNGESWRESKIYKPGKIARTVDIADTCFGLSICYDVRFPHLYRHQALAGARVLTAPAAFTRQTGRSHWHTLMRARAIENGAFMLAAAQGGDHEDGRETYGHSLVVDPWGKVIAELDHDEPGYLIAEIDPALSNAARAKVPNLANSREFVLEHSLGHTGDGA